MFSFFFTPLFPLTGLSLFFNVHALCVRKACSCLCKSDTEERGWGKGSGVGRKSTQRDAVLVPLDLLFVFHLGAVWDDVEFQPFVRMGDKEEDRQTCA